MIAMQIRRPSHTRQQPSYDGSVLLPESRSGAGSTGPARRARWLFVLAATIGLAACGGSEPTTDKAVSDGNAAEIRAEYAVIDPLRAAAFEAISGGAAAEEGNPAPPLWSIPLVSSAGYPSGSGDPQSPANADDAGGKVGTSNGAGDTTTTVVTAEVTTRPSSPFAAEALDAINAARAQARVCGDTAYPAAPPVRWNVRAAFAALLEVEWMQRDNTFGHAWPTGEHVWHRLVMSGYDWSRADENIAAGFRNLGAAMEAWIESPSHCRALMRQDVVDVGVAVIPGEARNTYLSYWAMVLAAPR